MLDKVKTFLPCCLLFLKMIWKILFRQRNGGTSLKLIEKFDKDIRNGEFDIFLKLFVLMYADDTILLADNEIDMQILIYH